MSHLEAVRRELVQRRLLPVAILLLVALVAIPFVLAEDPEPIAPAAPAPAAGADATLTATAPSGESVVSLTTDGERTERRRVLGARKNPFEPAKAPRAAATPESDATAAQEPGAGGGTPSSGGGTASPGSSGGTGTTPPAMIAPTTPPATEAPPERPRLSYELYSLTVRFGDTSAGSLDRLNLPRLKPLPSAEDPILIYLGVGEDEKTAVFIVDANVEPQGDGTCKPSPANCETIHLRKGDTEFFDVTDEAGEVTAQYQLDLLDVKRTTTASASEAKAARSRASKAGRRELRARGPLRYRYDAESGTVRKLDAKAFKALVAKTAKATGSLLGGF